MSKAMKVSLVAALTLVLAVAAISVAAGSRFSMKARLSGFQEVPALSTPGRGTFSASYDGTSIRYSLTFSGIPTTVLQSHIHFGQFSVNGGISLFLCSNLGNGPAGTQACPQEGTITGTLTGADVIGPASQGIAPGEFSEIVAAIRGGVAYVNVHSEERPGGEIRGQIKVGGGDDQGDQD